MDKISNRIGDAVGDAVQIAGQHLSQVTEER